MVGRDARGPPPLSTINAQGWLDVTYTSQDGNFRLSRGNKGTLFILVREDDFKSKLEEAISAKEDDKVCAGKGGGV